MSINIPAFYPELVEPVRFIGGKEFDFSRRVVVMAILNRTPNSNLDPHKSMEVESLARRAEEVVAEGADWIDVGGRAFIGVRTQLPAQVEIDRVVPVIEAIREKTDAVISIDTHLPEVALAAHQAGAQIVNDTYALQSPGMTEVVAETGMGVIVAHSLAGPGIHLERPTYSDVTADVARFLQSRVEHALQHGIQPNRIFIDPGHDLHKNTFDSLELTRDFKDIARLGYPAMAAVSNKHLIWESLGVERGTQAVTHGTVAANSMCVYMGARLVRVHDVRRNVTAMRQMESLLGLGERGAAGVARPAEWP
ncbi:dihydropteroate synthase (plasmid) [Actinomadura sp. ATCC 31491]|uniref:Dihydropteroate synthase n=1 Tax=Actinomadura luzonensis TaxID=2805427 RepID=A0ABT0FTM1_9ACTN|nr:dihydropteroate synthase [Actinomadura luzonensis]MCK2215248.1 dihydropteroate synthase [Actinomadura luzonensis]MCK2222024.1 dihydropteroate synthase [Actinomadura luzonensis]